MNTSFFLRHKRIVFALSFGFSLLLIALLLNLLYKSKQAIVTTPTIPTPFVVAPPEKVYSLQKTIIGKTTNEEVEKKPDLLKKETLPTGEIKYSFKSPLSTRPNEIITKDGQVVFERVLAPPVTDDSIRMPTYRKQYGSPEKVLRGSNAYGYWMETHIYARLGFAFVANPNNNEIFEFHSFKPTTPETYIQTYGQDINSSLGPAIEGPVVSKEEDAVGAFKGTLPYYGKNFSVFYDLSFDKTTVVIYEDIPAGEKEFDEYLKKFNIESRSWIKNMTIEYHYL